MTTNKAAYDCIRSAIAAAQLGFHDARTAREGAVFLAIYHKLDDELDEMVARSLTASTGAYQTLTAGMKSAKKEVSDVLDDLQNLVKATDAAVKIATLFAKLLAIL